MNLGILANLPEHTPFSLEFWLCFIVMGLMCLYFILAYWVPRVSKRDVEK